MLNQRLTAARTVATELHKFEKALDEALTLGSHLSATMIQARLDAKLAAAVGQDALEGVIKTLSLMTDARRQLVTAHGELKDVADGIGVPTVGAGDLLKPPTRGSTEDKKLQVVA